MLHLAHRRRMATRRIANLVLSSQARADSIPGLEILADDVRCTHGATVGKIDADQVFTYAAGASLTEKPSALSLKDFSIPSCNASPLRVSALASRMQSWRRWAK